MMDRTGCVFNDNYNDKEYILNQVIVFFLNKHETNFKFFVHDGQNQLRFQR